MLQIKGIISLQLSEFHWGKNLLKLPYKPKRHWLNPSEILRIKKSWLRAYLGL